MWIILSRARYEGLTDISRHKEIPLPVMWYANVIAVLETDGSTSFVKNRFTEDKNIPKEEWEEYKSKFYKENEF